MAKSTQLNIKVKGIDQATAVFKRIGSTARTVAVGVAAVAVAGAAAAAAVMKTWQAMTKIGDLAQKGGLGAAELQKMAGAMGQLGIQGASVEQLSQAFAVMQKNTGKSGLDGFFQVLDEAKSGGGIKALTDAFGKAGLNFAPLLAGDTDALKRLVEMQYAMADSSVVAAERASNAWALACDGFKAAWFDFSGELAKGLDEDVEGGVYAAAFKAAEYVRAAIKSIKNSLIGVWSLCKMMAGAIAAPFIAVGKTLAAVGASVADILGGIWDAIRTRSLDPIKLAMERVGETMKTGLREAFLENGGVKLFDESRDALGKSMSDIVDNFQEAKRRAADAVGRAAAFTAAKSKAAGTFTGSNFGNTSSSASSASAASVGQARNDLILGGSHASMTAALRRNTDAQRTRVATEESAKALREINEKLNLEGV